MTINKPRILLVGPTPPLIGGISSYISNLLNSNLSEKFDLTSFSTNRPSNKGKVPSQNYKVIFNVPFLYLCKSMIFTMYHLIKFPVVLSTNNPYLVHIHSPSYWSFVENSFYVTISKLFGKKVVLHIHGGGFDKFYLNSFRFMKYYIKFIMNLSDRIISISRCWESFFINNIGISEKSISVVYNGFESSIFFPMDMKECRKSLNLPLDTKIILTVGNLLEEKGHKYLIKALSEILIDRKDFICIIIGDGKLRATLEEQISSVTFNDYILLMGEKPHDEIPLWMNAADFFVLPSLIEGNPLVMSESLGIGLPFIGTKVGAIPEIISTEDYGFLVEPGNSNDLTEIISVALDTNWDRDKIRKYAECFKWDNISNDLLNIYTSLH